MRQNFRNSPIIVSGIAAMGQMTHIAHGTAKNAARNDTIVVTARSGPISCWVRHSQIHSRSCGLDSLPKG